MDFSPKAFFFAPPEELFSLCEESLAVWDLLKNLPVFLKTWGGGINSFVPTNCHIENSDTVFIDEGVTIEPLSYIKGPAVILKGAVIRQGAYLRGGVFAGQGSVIGHSTEIKNAILFPRAQAAHFAYVGDSILGEGVNLGAGTKLANLRFDHGEIFIKHGSERIATGLKKMGAILGDRAQTGCNSVTNPGTLMLPGAVLAPCANKGGCIFPLKSFEGAVF